jgi:6-phosphogluconolactonase
MSNVNVIICADPDALAVRGAELIVGSAREAIRQRGQFTLVLSGGSTPEKTYRQLAGSDTASAIDWSRTYLFLGDERFVPPDDPASNFGMVRRSLLDHVQVPDAHVFPVPSVSESAAKAARQYNETIARFFRQAAQTDPPPGFDLILLGLGDDGHTASLFPGMSALEVNDAWVTSSPPGILPPPVERVTMTFPILNRARHALFLVAGEKKAQVLHEILEGEPSVTNAPAAGIRPVAGAVTWLVDEPAARRLTPTFLEKSIKTV